MGSLLTITLLVIAPAPLPRRDREVQLFLAAEQAHAQAEAIDRRLLLEKLAPPQQAALQKEARGWVRRAAELYARVASGNGPRRDEAGLKAGAAWNRVGEFNLALTAFETVAGRTVAQTRVEALGGMVNCHVVLSQPSEVRRHLLAIRAELPRLEKASRENWERWVEAAENPLSR